MVIEEGAAKAHQNLSTLSSILSTFNIVRNAFLNNVLKLKLRKLSSAYNDSSCVFLVKSDYVKSINTGFSASR